MSPCLTSALAPLVTRSTKPNPISALITHYPGKPAAFFLMYSDFSATGNFFPLYLIHPRTVKTALRKSRLAFAKRGEKEKKKKKKKTHTHEYCDTEYPRHCFTLMLTKLSLGKLQKLLERRTHRCEDNIETDLQ